MTADTRPIPAVGRERGGAGYAFPILLVTLGVYALLVNLGAVPAPRWNELLALWPLLLVIFGLDILLTRRAPLLGVLVIAVIVALALVVVSVSAAAAPFGQLDRMAVATDGAGASELKLSFAGGRLAMSGGGPGIAEVSSDRDNVGSTVTRSSDRVAVELQRNDARPTVSATQWTVSLSDAVVYDVDLDLAAGEFDLDLRSIPVTSVSVNVAMGDLYLVLPRPRGDARITVDGAMSSVVIAVPTGTAARITSDGVLGTFTGGEFGGYASSADRLTVVAKGALASIQVRELP